jgi:catechol-2,3-dioxygenase
MTFFTLGRHHDFAVVEAGEGAASPDGGGLGLDHIAFKVGDSLDDLRAAKTRLEQEGIPVASVDHTVSHSLYCHDPDGNTVELYVDTPAPWRDDPSLIVAEARPLDL